VKGQGFVKNGIKELNRGVVRAKYPLEMAKQTILAYT